MLIDNTELGNKIIQDLTELAGIGPGVQTIDDLENVTWPTGTWQTVQDRIDEVRTAWSDRLAQLEADLETKRTAKVTELAQLKTKLLDTVDGKDAAEPKGTDTFVIGGYVRDTVTGNGLPFLAIKVHNADHEFARHTSTDKMGWFTIDIDAAAFDGWVGDTTMTVTIIDETGAARSEGEHAVTPAAGQAATVTVNLIAGDIVPASFEFSKSVAIMVTKLVEDYGNRANMIDARMLAIKKRS